MNKIVSKEQFSEKVTKLVVEAPLIAKVRKAGHFVIVRCGEKGERIPLTIADSDPKAGTITLVIQAVGNSTQKILALNPGDCLTDVVGRVVILAGQAPHHRFRLAGRNDRNGKRDELAHLLFIQSL